jgi:hypothetical protein
VAVQHAPLLLGAPQLRLALVCAQVPLGERPLGGYDSERRSGGATDDAVVVTVRRGGVERVACVPQQTDVDDAEDAALFD